ncbi:leucyl-tRNA synthetase [Xylona heveae TC161]|uniref:leucine--tRNA ligase n=1 Tax=Xylona heveae (strain CBS 132557 / TC161) TaxID=1328760 RepID=A0A165A218_XYLHT|nr:leucyl-tRNA synthetase [Xylona heveae TC161]KZF19842.1 leucyl-tRNA synthetase [Xylona heveae TC161]
MAATQATLSAMDPSKSSKNTIKLENTEKRDTLIAIEKKYQQKWAEDKVFEPNAPSTKEIPLQDISAADLRAKYPKFFGTMAYPYMNGTLHAGHSFSVSKIEFTAGVARMQGKRALFPMGFHCTGMPIKACADKLVREVEMFGKEFERCPETNITNSQPEETPAPTEADTKEDITKFTAKKGKAAAKAVKLKYQFQIMLALGIPLAEIHKFADPQHWLQFFPPLCRRDLTNFGARIDWRRSMVTTDANPYYDAFVRWQMNRLKELQKIRFGKRYTVYSPKDGQPCMDHDRSEGEAIGPQEYTAVKLKVKEWAPEAAKLVESKLPANANVFFVPATLRPETMYGQTCCFVGPKITYGVFKAGENDYFVVTERAARNMAFQGAFPKWGEYEKVAELPGTSVIGTLVNAPLSMHTEGVRILPMETVKATKGTGVVTSVPSDSPDDYATVLDLAKKADFYGIKKEWAELEIIPILETPSYGNLTAPFLVKKLKINSPKDAAQLEEAKGLAYKEGFYQGTILVGKYKGQKVEHIKDNVKRDLIDAGDAFEYAEPAGLVISRSGDECVVAHLDQWFLNYGNGDEEWQKTTLGWISEGLNTFTTETKHQFEKTIDWLNQWACARSYGLGSKLPWDHSFLVESLSDSTIYMSYYTIAHLLHKDIFGKEPGLAGVKAEQMTDEVWDYIFTRRELSDEVVKSGISKDSLESMRREFQYWYPLDLRVSGKDLIPNHLTFFLYIHTALFPKEFWPRAVRANGHLTLNGEKMSKHTGNFLTLDDTVKKYGADASRVALADAGDGIEDANFEESVANSSILRLFTLKEWCEKIAKLAKGEQMRDEIPLRTGPKVFWDKLFENEMYSLANEAKNHYSATNYKLALKSAFYDFTTARDFYRESTTASRIGMHKDVALQYIKLQALLMAVITPHWSEYIWQEVLEQPATIQNELFPELPEADVTLLAAREYVRTTTSNITSAEAAQQKKKDKGKSVAFDPKKAKKLTIFATTKYPSWQEKYIDLVREAFDGVSINDKELNPKVAKFGEMKKAMPFVQGLKRRLAGGESANIVFDRKLPFDELDTLKEMAIGLSRTTGCKAIEVIAVDEGGKTGTVIKSVDVVGTGVDSKGKEETTTQVDQSADQKRTELPQPAEGAVPGVPTFHFENI